MKKFKSIAIDGPAGAGKSDVSDILAEKLNFVHVDTGALYRAIALCFLGKPINEHSIEDILSNSFIDVKFINNTQLVYLNGEDVTNKLRSPEISKLASDISSFKNVREFLLSLQRELADSNNVIMDGRDISTVVLPDADIKIFLTASPEERAKRRFKQLDGDKVGLKYDEILHSIKTRDYNDAHRKIAPLKPADDSFIYDTTYSIIDEVVDCILNYVGDRLDVNL